MTDQQPIHSLDLVPLWYTVIVGDEYRLHNQTQLYPPNRPELRPLSVQRNWEPFSRHSSLTDHHQLFDKMPHCNLVIEPSASGPIPPSLSHSVSLSLGHSSMEQVEGLFLRKKVYFFLMVLVSAWSFLSRTHLSCLINLPDW